MYIVAVFSSRNETLYFANILKNNGFYVSIINTPKEAGQACGISVKFNYSIFNIAKEILYSNPFRTFVGFYSINLKNNRHQYYKI